MILFLTPGASSQASVEKRSTQPINVKVTGETNTLKKLIAILVALSVVTVLTAASCGGSGGGGGTGAGGPGARPRGRAPESTWARQPSFNRLSRLARAAASTSSMMFQSYTLLAMAP